jgi:hypothetical protein
MSLISLQQVTTVAHLVSIEEYGTKFEFSLEDGTRGRINARQWRSDEYGNDCGNNNDIT